MRRLLIVLGVFALCSAPTWADSIEAYQLFGPGFLVTSSASNGGMISCACTDPEFGTAANFSVYNLGSADPLGSLYFSGQGLTMAASLFNVVYTPGSPNFVTLQASFTGISGPNNTPITGTFYEYQDPVYGVPGTAGWTIGGSVNINQTQTVPDGDSSLLIGACALGAVGLAWRWRRQEVDGAKMVHTH
jgi:hypothetical protein